MNNNGQHDWWVLENILKHPLLKEEETRELIVRWREFGDRKARERLELSNMRLIWKIGKRVLERRPNHLVMLDEFFLPGILALRRAFTDFDLDSGYKFSTYAAYKIRSQIERYVKDNCRLVRIPSTTQDGRTASRVDDLEFQESLVVYDPEQNEWRHLDLPDEDLLQRQEKWFKRHSVQTSIPALTQQEKRVVERILENAEIEDIAEEFGCGVANVSFHKTGAVKKLKALCAQ